MNLYEIDVKKYNILHKLKITSMEYMTVILLGLSFPSVLVACVVKALHTL